MSSASCGNDPKASCLIENPGSCKSSTGNVVNNFGFGLARTFGGILGLSSLIPNPTNELSSALSSSQSKLQQVVTTHTSMIAAGNIDLISGSHEDLKSAINLAQANVDFHDTITNDKINRVNYVVVMMSILIFAIIFYILF
jgi:hypothetical protein